MPTCPVFVLLSMCISDVCLLGPVRDTSTPSDGCSVQNKRWKATPRQAWLTPVLVNTPELAAGMIASVPRCLLRGAARGWAVRDADIRPSWSVRRMKQPTTGNDDRRPSHRWLIPTQSNHRRHLLGPRALPNRHHRQAACHFHASRH
jgi:hypothetical protein